MTDTPEENTFKNIFFISTKDFPGGKVIQFNIEAAKDQKFKDIYETNKLLVFSKDLCYGKLFENQDTGEDWYIDHNSTFATKISKSQLELILAWDKEPLRLSDEHFKVISKIGGIPSSVYSASFIQFPARVESSDGQKSELCIFHFSKTPPFQWHFKKVLLLNNNYSIYPSSLALSHDLRLSSTLMGEIRMGFSPFMVKTKEGKFITYNGTTQFASKGEIKGADIDCQVNFSYDKYDKTINVPFDKITYIICKWDSRLEKLFNQYRAELERLPVKKNYPVFKKQTWLEKLLGT